jgi:ABC-type Co2+ transport system permease subunit
MVLPFGGRQQIMLLWPIVGGRVYRLLQDIERSSTSALWLCAALGDYFAVGVAWARNRGHHRIMV